MNENQERNRMSPTFNLFLSSLSMQTLIFLGEIDSPITHKKDENLDQAKFIINTLTMLKDKTKGNLTEEEDHMMDNILYELRMKYTAKTGKI